MSSNFKPGDIITCINNKHNNYKDQIVWLLPFDRYLNIGDKFIVYSSDKTYVKFYRLEEKNKDRKQMMELYIHRFKKTLGCKYRINK